MLPTCAPISELPSNISTMLPSICTSFRLLRIYIYALSIPPKKRGRKERGKTRTFFLCYAKGVNIENRTLGTNINKNSLARARARDKKYSKDNKI